MIADEGISLDRLKPKLRGDIEAVAGFIEELRRGEIDEEAFKPKRLLFGIYGQRQPGVHMVRVKIPYGGLNPEQIRALAEVADQFSTGIAHLTTRQDVQFHFVRLDDVIPLLVRLAEAGLTTREACGNTVRNVTACPVAGLSPTEPFDVTPYAAQVSRHFLRNDISQSLPRKFKIAFDGCANEGTCVGAAFHDIAALAALREGKRGFRLYVGGGLGNTPKPARLWEAFTPEEDLVRTMHAIVQVFGADGNRRNRNRARIKFLIQTLGWEEFRARVLQARDQLPPGFGPSPDFTSEEKAPQTSALPSPEPQGAEYREWKRDNVLPQKQAGFNAITVVLPLGDIRGPQLATLSRIAAVYADGRARITRGQNILLRWVRNENLPGLWRELREAELAETGADGISDITSCPGADTCNLGITSSKGLARALRTTIREAGEELASARRLTIKISGCPNSCGQHHVADIGLYGSERRVGEVEIPSYTMLLGGSPRPSPGDAEFGETVGRIAARLVPAAVVAVARFSLQERREDESFGELVRRLGVQPFQAHLAAFLEDPTPEKIPGLRIDWGQSENFAAPKNMKGECSA